MLVFILCRFAPYSERYKEDHSIAMKPKVTIQKKGVVPRYVHFIVRGRAVVSNSTGNYPYFKLPEGSWFGESYLLFGLPSSYAIVHESGQAVHTLRISGSKFLKICRKYPDSTSILLERAIMRRRRFREYKIEYLENMLDQIFHTRAGEK